MSSRFGVLFFATALLVGLARLRRHEIGSTDELSNVRGKPQELTLRRLGLRLPRTLELGDAVSLARRYGVSELAVLCRLTTVGYLSEANHSDCTTSVPRISLMSLARRRALYLQENMADPAVVALAAAEGLTVLTSERRQHSRRRGSRKTPPL